jgi:hypothetical protein
MELELNTIIGDPAKLGRDCEIHQHKCLIYSFIICYIRMIVFVGIIQILMFYKVISFSHRLPDVSPHQSMKTQLKSIQLLLYAHVSNMSIYNICTSKNQGKPTGNH